MYSGMMQLPENAVRGKQEMSVWRDTVRCHCHGTLLGSPFLVNVRLSGLCS